MLQMILKPLKDAVQDYMEHFPCEECREHFSELVKDAPVSIGGGENHRRHLWTWLTHNLVNKRLGKECTCTTIVSNDNYMLNSVRK